MRNKDCKVVLDLLPNYIEKLTSEETNKFIEEHLQECPECKAMLESMKAEIKINTAKQDDREVEYIKKFNVKFKKFKKGSRNNKKNKKSNMYVKYTLRIMCK